MGERGFGRIVVIASEWGVDRLAERDRVRGLQGRPDRLVKSAARALGPHGIAVNAIAPGITDTPQLQVDADDAGLSLAEIERYAATFRSAASATGGDRRRGRLPLQRAAAIALVGQVLQPNGGTTRRGGI